MRTIINLIIRFGIVELFLLFFVLANLFTFFLFFLDKRKATKGKWRISENVLIFFTLACGGFGAFVGMWLARHKTRKTKFRVALVAGLIIAVIPVIHIVHGFTLDRIVRFVEIAFHSENWSAELDGYRIAFMTDMHIIPDENMRSIVAELNERNIDLLVLGGDFSMRDNHYQGTIREISQTLTTDGIFGVEGNHDDYVRVFRAKEEHGIIPLHNSGIHIRDGFFLAGVHDLWNRNPNVEAAISSANAEDFVLLISHNPDVVMMQSTAGIDLVLSGHTHGGQITFFGVPLYLLRGSITNYGMRFGYGFAYSPDGVPVFTSSGVGDYYTIPRIFARPEVVIFTVYNVD
jgi:predicted MPP superfamily phosphohydrolase